MAAPRRDCPSDQLIGCLVDAANGGLTPRTTAELRRHLQRCTRCYRLVVALCEQLRRPMVNVWDDGDPGPTGS